MGQTQAILGDGTPTFAGPTTDLVACGAERAVPASRPRLLATLVMSDVIALASVALAVGAMGRQSSGLGVGAVMLATAAMTVLGVVMLRATGLFRTRVCEMRSVELAKLARVAAGTAVAAYALRLVPPGHPWQVVAAAVATFAALAIERSAYRSWVRGRRRRGDGLRPVLVVGSVEDNEVIVSTMRDSPELGYLVCGVVTLPQPPGWTALVIERAREFGANGLVVAPGAAPLAETAQLLRSAATMGLHVQVWGGLPGIDQRRLQPLPLGHHPGFYLTPSGAHPWHQVAKRALDLALAPLALLASLPVLLAVVVLIKLEDGGPVIFRQRRVGKNGREFTVYKFRSMVVDAETQLDALWDENERVGSPLFKLYADPRTTRIGRFLRATSIDEIPQLINVIKGDMTLVGPRPALASEVAQFDDELLQRLRVAPGLTGLWQVEARDKPSFDAYRSLDLFYVENWSIELDLAILATTAAVVVARAFRSIHSLTPRTEKVVREPLSGRATPQVNAATAR